MSTSQADPQAAPAACGSDVCNLPAHEMEARRRVVQNELLPKANRSVRLRDGRAWEFPAEAGMRESLEELVAFERECCPGLRWDLSDVGDAGGLRLEIAGLPPDHPFWSPTTEAGEQGLAPPSSLRRIAKAVGLGAGVSFVLCCVLPVAGAALFGAAVAAPFATLDNPLFIGLGSLTAAVPAWLWLRRREAARLRVQQAAAAEASEAACGC